MEKITCLAKKAALCQKYLIPSRQGGIISMAVPGQLADSKVVFSVFTDTTDWPERLSGVPGKASWLLLRQTAGGELRDRLTAKTQMCDGSGGERRYVFVIRALMFSASDVLKECPV